MSTIGNSIHPRDVIAMEAQGTLPPLARTKWKERTGKDPVDAARACFQSRRTRILLGVACIIAAAILMALGVWLFGRVDMTTLLDLLPMAAKAARIGVLLILVSGFLLVLTGAWFFLECRSKIRKFTWHGEFGKEFPNLLGYLKQSPETFPTEEGLLRAATTEFLVTQAVEACKVYATLKERLIADEITGEDYDHQRLSAKSRFGYYFGTFKLFGLTDKKGWDPYFAEARKRLAAI